MNHSNAHVNQRTAGLLIVIFLLSQQGGRYVEDDQAKLKDDPLINPGA